MISPRPIAFSVSVDEIWLVWMHPRMSDWDEVHLLYDPWIGRFYCPLRAVDDNRVTSPDQSSEQSRTTAMRIAWLRDSVKSDHYFFRFLMCTIGLTTAVRRLLNVFCEQQIRTKSFIYDHSLVLLGESETRVLIWSLHNEKGWTQIRKKKRRDLIFYALGKTEKRSKS